MEDVAVKQHSRYDDDDVSPPLLLSMTRPSGRHSLAAV